MRLYHKEIHQTMLPYKGKTLKTGYIIGQVMQAHNLDKSERKWIQPSDHCDNNDAPSIKRKSTWWCDKCRDDSSNAIFHKIDRGIYQVR